MNGLKRYKEHLLMAYNPKVSTLNQDREKLEDLTMDELYGILTAYELRLGIGNLPKGEATFNVIKKTNQKKKSQTNHDEESDEEEANFVKKLQKGSGKYKGKLPLKCFNCGGVGNFHAECPYPKEDSEDEDDKNKQYKKEGKFHYKKNYKGKNNFYSKEEDNSSSEVSDNDDGVLFLGIEESNEI